MNTNFPNKICEAVDLTTDNNNLSLLWEVTKFRIDEEKERENRALDRAGKYITYSFSVLTVFFGIITFYKDSFKYVIKLDALPLNNLIPFIGIGLLVSIIISALIIFISAAKVLKIRNYRTWNEPDLARVDLVSDFAYKRYLIKAAWTFLPKNIRINDKKAINLSCALKSFFSALILLFFFLIFTFWIHTYIANQNLGNYNNMPQNEQNNSSQPSNSPKTNPNPQPPPTPKPSSGDVIKKGQTPPTKPIVKTPNPTAGAIRKDGGG